MEILKPEFINKVASIGNMSKKDADACVSAVLASIVSILSEGDSLKLSGFGTFYMKQLPARSCMNISTGKPMDVPARHKPAFKPGSVLKSIKID